MMKSPTEFEKEAFALTDLENFTSPDQGNFTSPDQGNFTSSEPDTYASPDTDNATPVGHENHYEYAEVPNSEIDHHRIVEKYFVPNDEDTRPADQLPVTAKKCKQEARQVCGKISRLLRDKRSRTRGSCMFRKRRRRSEKFAIIGYGTQPVDEEPATDSSAREESESLSVTSTDDEIPVYDRPGPNNLLEQDACLSASEKVVQHQLRGLAMDAVQMKGKGAKLFARRQRRMEKFVLEGPEETPPNPTAKVARPQQRPDPVAFVNQPNAEGGEERCSYTPVTYNNIHAGRSAGTDQGQERHVPGQFDTVTSEDGSGSCTQPTKRGRRSRPRDRMPWAAQGKFASADWSTDDESPHTNKQNGFSSDRGGQHPSEGDQMYVMDQPAVQQVRFRSVRPPVPPVVASAKQHVDSTTETDNAGNIDLKRPKEFSGNATIRLGPGADRPPSRSGGKSWSSVQFQPKQNPKKEPDVENSRVAYPFALSTASSAKPQSITLMNLSNARQPNQTAKSFTSAPSAKSKAPVSHSVSLLQQPIPRSRSPSPRRNADPMKTSVQEPQADVQDRAIDAPVIKSVHGDLSPKRMISPEPLQDSMGYRPPSQNRNVKAVPYPHHFNSPAAIKQPQQESNPSQPAQEETKKPKVAACMKLLDPNRKYEPKMELVYKQTTGIGAKLDENERPPSRNRNSGNQQFNKPVTINHNQPQTTYLQQRENTCQQQDQKKPKALGSIAGRELKGKGAKMFEKQQQRMGRYTKECNGNKPPQVVPQPLSSYGNSQAPKVPGEKTRESMSNVLGEFRRVSDSDVPKRPSATKRSKSRDPYFYQQYYVARRPPSAADFVCVDDAANSDSNNSGASSLTSYERTSTTSSGKQPEDVFENNGSPTPKGPPPRVAPKPKLRRVISSDSNPPTVLATSEGGSELEATRENGSQQHIPNECVGQLATDDKDQREVVASDEKTDAEPAFRVWAPGQPAHETPSFDHLPPPPTYTDVTSHADDVPKPKFRVTNASYQTYSPRSASANFDMGQLEGNLPPIDNNCPATFTCPRPKFTANATASKWQPGSQQQ